MILILNFFQNKLLRNLKLIKRLYVNLETQVFSLSDHVANNALFVFLLVIQGTGILIGSAVFPEMIKDSCWLVGGGGDPFWAVLASGHAAIVAPKGT